MKSVLGTIFTNQNQVKKDSTNLYLIETNILNRMPNNMTLEVKMC